MVNQTHKNATKCVEENLNEAKFTGKNAKQEINKIGEGAKADLNMKFIKCQMGFLPRDCYDTLPPVMANAAKKTVAKIVALIKDFDYQLVGILTGIRKCWVHFFSQIKRKEKLTLDFFRVDDDDEGGSTKRGTLVPIVEFEKFSGGGRGTNSLRQTEMRTCEGWNWKVIGSQVVLRKSLLCFFPEEGNYFKRTVSVVIPVGGGTSWIEAFLIFA